MATQLLEDQAREKAGMPPEWSVYLWENIGDHLNYLCARLTGAVAPLYKSGIYKGATNWSNKDVATIRTVHITPAEQDAYEAAWEAKTGKCATCLGKGEAIKSSSTTAGRTWTPCRACKATGAARKPQHKGA